MAHPTPKDVLEESCIQKDPGQDPSDRTKYDRRESNENNLDCLIDYGDSWIAFAIVCVGRSNERIETEPSRRLRTIKVLRVFPVCCRDNMSLSLVTYPS